MGGVGGRGYECTGRGERLCSKVIGFGKKCCRTKNYDNPCGAIRGCALDAVSVDRF
jgi:hypothetical protein